MFPLHLGYYNFTGHTRWLAVRVRSFIRSFVIVIGIQWIHNMKPDDEPSKRREREGGRRNETGGLKYSSPHNFVR